MLNVELQYRKLLLERKIASLENRDSLETRKLAYMKEYLYMLDNDYNLPLTRLKFLMRMDRANDIDSIIIQKLNLLSYLKDKMKNENFTPLITTDEIKAEIDKWRDKKNENKNILELYKASLKCEY